MGRRRHHEEHANHEAWAIPYGDLVTLLLAFFVVMYAISSINEGKYRVLADSLSEAFGGPPRTISPMQLGSVQPLGSAPDTAPPLAPTAGARGAIAPKPLRDWTERPHAARSAADTTLQAREQAQLGEVATRIERALAPLIDQKLVRVRRTTLWLEVEISSDVLFESARAVPAPQATATLRELGDALRAFPNPLRVEGHTDDRPIASLEFPSNWELSAARAAAVVRIFMLRGIAPDRLAVVGYGPFRPARDNFDAEGRSANRRVTVVVLAQPDAEPAAMGVD